MASATPDGPSGSPGGIFDAARQSSSGLQRIDNITDTALRTFRDHYTNLEISKGEIFEYVYGVLHAPEYRKRFANDLSKALPRIPMAPNFGSFAAAGRELMELHLSYETCAEYPLEVAVEGSASTGEVCRIGRKKMKWGDPEDRTVLRINDRVRLLGIPAEAHKYVVNGRTPLEWFIDRYQVKKDKRSGIVNDPNGWFGDSRDLVAAFKRIVYVSVETVRIVAGLPTPFEVYEGP